MPNETIDTSEPGVWTTGPEGELIPDYESTFPTINEGEVVHGTVVRVDKDEVLVDIGYKSEGVIPVAELSIRRSVNPADEVSVGDEIDEGAEVDDVGNLALDDVAWVEPVEDRLAHLLALVLEDGAAREHDVVPRAIELDHLGA